MRGATQCARRTAADPGRRCRPIPSLPLTSRRTPSAGAAPSVRHTACSTATTRRCTAPTVHFAAYCDAGRRELLAALTEHNVQLGDRDERPRTARAAAARALWAAADTPLAAGISCATPSRTYTLFLTPG